MVSPTPHFKSGKMMLEKDIDKRAASFKGRGIDWITTLSG